jgi:hypothetical protein
LEAPNLDQNPLPSVIGGTEILFLGVARPAEQLKIVHFIGAAPTQWNNMIDF